jgi:pimeloyl-ACP methyl ester carboxylesterase
MHLVTRRFILLSLLAALMAPPAWAGTSSQIVDVPTRPGVTQRLLLLTPESPRAAVVLFAGGHGGLQISSTGAFGWGGGNFLVRTRDLFAAQDLTVAVVDAPSDRQRDPFLGGFRQTPQHVSDIKAVIAWLKQHGGLPVWLVGTSRGTQSAAYIATQLDPAAGGPDGLVLTSTILTDPRGRPVPDMALDRVVVPVLVVHHRADGCRLCAYSEIPRLMKGLSAAPRKELVTVEGGQDRGDPCEALAHHGFNGLEREVVARIAAWIVSR